MEGLTKHVPSWQTGVLKAAQSPLEQMDNVLHKWISGREIVYERMFNDLMPMKDEVWELKTADLRIFGWMYRPCVFIAVFVDYADWYKGKNPKCSYDVARKTVVEVRNKLNLDEPKLTGGTFDALVRI